MKISSNYGRRLHPDNSTSAYLLVKKLSQESFSSIVVYKPHGEKTLIGPSTLNDIDVKKDTFVIGIQTRQQLNMFKKNASKIVCMDSTHQTNQYQFPLTTLLVPDEFNKGYPVAHLISNHTDELTLRSFLQEIKNRCGKDIKVNVVMTDDDNADWNAFFNVFGESRHLLCKWHIKKAWRGRLPLVGSKDLQKEVYQLLNVIMGEKDCVRFGTIL